MATGAITPVSFAPDIYTPLNWALGTYGIPKPTGSYNLSFSVQQYAPLVDAELDFRRGDVGEMRGFAADAYRPTPFGTGHDVTTNAVLGSLFNGMDVDLAVRDTDAWLYRLGYSVTLIGKIVFPFTPVIS